MQHNMSDALQRLGPFTCLGIFSQSGLQFYVILAFFTYCRKCQFVPKSQSKAKKRKSLDDSSSGLEIKTPMTLRSQTRKSAELVSDKGHNLCPKNVKNKKNYTK